MKRDPVFDSSTDLSRFDLNAKRTILLAEWLGWTARWGSATRRMVILTSPKREKQLNIPTTNVNQKRVLSWAHALATYSPPDRLEQAIDGKIPDNPELASMLSVIGTKSATRTKPAPKQKEKTALGLALEEALEKKEQPVAQPTETAASLNMPGDWYEYVENGVTKYVCRAPHTNRQPFYAKSKASAMGHSNVHQSAEWRQTVLDKSIAAKKRQAEARKSVQSGEFTDNDIFKDMDLTPAAKGETTVAEAIRGKVNFPPIPAFTMPEDKTVTIEETETEPDVLTQIANLVSGPLVAKVAELERELARVKTERDALRRQAETAQENLRALQEMINGLMGKG